MKDAAYTGKKALVTGIAGQDGSYLAELLLSKGYEVHGIESGSRDSAKARVNHLFADWRETDARLFLHFADPSDSANLAKLFYRVAPDEIYHLDGQKHAGFERDTGEYAKDIKAAGTTCLLNAIRESNIPTRFCNAVSSEIFGQATQRPQNESTPLSSRSSHGSAELHSHRLTKSTRESSGLFAVNAILFNHESTRRDESFTSRRITRAVARILHGLQDKLSLGNLDAERDWGYAPEYVEGMWRMLQQVEPDDYVLATGETHSVLEFVDLAFAHAGLNWRRHIEIDSSRPNEIDCQLGDPSKARQRLGWVPQTKFREVVTVMVDADVQIVEDKLSGRAERVMLARAGE